MVCWYNVMPVRVHLRAMEPIARRMEYRETFAVHWIYFERKPEIYSDCGMENANGTLCHERVCKTQSNLISTTGNNNDNVYGIDNNLKRIFSRSISLRFP